MQNINQNIEYLPETNNSAKYFNFQEKLENISLQLSNLYSAVDTMSIAFQQQKMDADVIGCLETICLAVKAIKQSMDEQIEKLSEINKE